VRSGVVLLTLVVIIVCCYVVSRARRANGRRRRVNILMLHHAVDGSDEHIPLISHNVRLFDPVSDKEKELCGEACSICLEAWQAGAEVEEFLPCHHLFHSDCLQEWQRRQQRSCPLCRTRVRPRGCASLSLCASAVARGLSFRARTLVHGPAVRVQPTCSGKASDAC
jgi:hypothetical protein